MPDFRYRNFTITQTNAAMKVGTDSDLLGTLGLGGDRILDIGTGTGILSLMYAQRYPGAHITAIEIDEHAVLDARLNIERSVYSDRIELHHISFQDYLLSNPEAEYDSVICNPPYFDRSLECPDLGRARARHSSSLPFDMLINGAYELLRDGGFFSVCIPPEVLDLFCDLCRRAGFSLHTKYSLQSLPGKPTKRYVLVHCKGQVEQLLEHNHCMRNSDGSRTPWFLDLLKDFLVLGG